MKRSCDLIHFNQSVVTIVVRAKPDNNPPASLIPTNGDILGEIPYTNKQTINKYRMNYYYGYSYPSSLQFCQLQGAS